MEKREPFAEEKRRKIIIISAVVALFALVVGILFAIIIPNLLSRRVDYLNDDLGKYISIDRESYIDYNLKVTLGEPSEAELSELLMRQQVKYRTLSGLGQYSTEGEIGVGDLLIMRYYVYTEDGAINGTSNITAGAAEYNVGAGFYIMNSAVTGLDTGLIGKRIEDIRANVGTAGTVADGQIVYLSYELTDGFEVISHVGERIDLSDPDIDSYMGQGFRDYLVGQPVGSAAKESLTTERDGKSVTYYAVKVDAVGNSPFVVSGRLPFDYYNDTLASKTVYFDLYIDKLIDYTVPELSDEFVTKKLGYSSFLDDFEGETVLDRYKTYLMTELSEEYEKRRNALIEDLLWEHLISSATLKKLPRNDVNDIYDGYYEEIVYQHESYGQEYSIGEFARLYIGLDASEDWQAYLLREAEAAVAEKLLFFYIIRAEGWVPEGEALDEYYERAVKAHLTAALEASDIRAEDFDTAEEYNNLVADVRSGLVKDFGEAYFTEIAYSEYGMEKILANISITDKD